MPIHVHIATIQLDASLSTDKVSYSFFFYKTFREIDEDTSFIDRPDVKVRNCVISGRYPASSSNNYFCIKSIPRQNPAHRGCWMPGANKVLGCPRIFFIEVH